MNKKWVSTRFAPPTQDFDLDVLVNRLRKGFILSAGLAAAIHLLVAGINPFAEAKKNTPRPLTTKFIKRQPRLTKPLELRKIPQPKRQLARREVQLARARMDQVQATASFNTRSLIANHVGGSEIRLASVVDFAALSTVVLEPKLVALEVTSTRTSEHKIDLALEMLDINALNTGRYRAMVLQDSGDPQAVKGFVKIAHVLAARHKFNERADGYSYLNLADIDRLCDTINEFTGLQASFIGTITYDDPRLHEMPLILPQGEPNEVEMANLAGYLIGGGVVIVNHQARLRDYFAEYWSEVLVKYGGLVAGQDFWKQRLTPGHPIYSAFFKLNGGFATQIHGQPTVRWGYFVKGRLVGISTPEWHDFAKNYKMTINTIVYALTQEGSITQRLMQMVH